MRGDAIIGTGAGIEIGPAIRLGIGLRRTLPPAFHVVTNLGCLPRQGILRASQPTRGMSSTRTFPQHAN